jgi:predicted amino acid dehydrogenase
MKRVLVVHVGREAETSTVTVMGQPVEIRRAGCGGDAGRARALIAEADGRVDAVALEGLPVELELGSVRRRHSVGGTLPSAARITPVVDGSGVRAGLERWGVILADRAQPGIFNHKRVLMVPGLNHGGLAQALGRRTPHLSYADPEIFFGLPDLPGIGSRHSLEPAAYPTLARLESAPFERLRPAAEGGGGPGPRLARIPFHRADVVAGDVGAIRRYAPPRLRGKTVVVEHAGEEDLEDLARRGAAIAVTLMPSLDDRDDLGRWSAAVVEAVLVALRADPAMPLTEDTYLDHMAQLDWKPAIRYLQPEEAGVHRFAFVIHPLSVGFIHKHPSFRWTRFLPAPLVEAAAAWMPPMYISRILGGRSPVTGQRIEGHLISLAATPRQMLRHGERFTYDRLNQAARMAERVGARVMGLGAFTSVVGDAGVTVAHEAGIAVTSGNSLTVAATLEAAKQAVRRMGKEDLTRGRAMVIGATGSIGSVCARLLAQAIRDVVLVSIEPEKLIDLKRTIERETPGARVTIATRSGDLLGGCDLVVTATSAFGQRIMDITRAKPGAVICDVARPTDISEAEAALRPDVLVIESGEVLIPGDIDFGYDIGLPPGTAYACLAETALLAMEGRFESYTLGRDIRMERVKEIYRLFKKHRFEIAGLRSFDRYVTDEELAEKRRLAEQLRADPELFEEVKREAGRKLCTLPVVAKGVRAPSTPRKLEWAAAGVAGAAVLGWWLGRRRRRGRREPRRP